MVTMDRISLVLHYCIDEVLIGHQKNLQVIVLLLISHVYGVDSVRNVEFNVVIRLQNLIIEKYFLQVLKLHIFQVVFIL